MMVCQGKLCCVTKLDPTTRRVQTCLIIAPDESGMFGYLELAELAGHHFIIPRVYPHCAWETYLCFWKLYCSATQSHLTVSLALKALRALEIVLQHSRVCITNLKQTAHVPMFKTPLH